MTDYLYDQSDKQHGRAVDGMSVRTKVLSG